MKKIVINIMIFTMLGITLVYYGYARHHGGGGGAAFGGSMLGGMTGSMIGSAMTKSDKPQTIIVQQPATQPSVQRTEGISAEDVQENLDDLRRAMKKDLNLLNDRIDSLENMVKKLQKQE